jgi:hypothetical protein
MGYLNNRRGFASLFAMLFAMPTSVRFVGEMGCSQIG